MIRMQMKNLKSSLPLNRRRKNHSRRSLPLTNCSLWWNESTNNKKRTKVSSKRINISDKTLFLVTLIKQKRLMDSCMIFKNSEKSMNTWDRTINKSGRNMIALSKIAISWRKSVTISTWGLISWNNKKSSRLNEPHLSSLPINSSII